MHLDVQDLRNFYYRQALGRSVQRVIRQEVLRIWPELSGQTVAGFGFAIPLLRPFLNKSRRVIALMPGPQGAMAWPTSQDNVSVLCEEAIWPIETGHIDRLIVLHGLETSDDQNAVLSEAFRVLGPGGKALFIVPNRVGLWSRSDLTPMGFGRPYTSGQLEAQLRIQGFLPEKSLTALYQPPTFKRRWQRFGAVIERFGRGMPFLAGGVLIVEASKRVHPISGSKIGKAAKQGLGVLEGLTSGKPKPVLRHGDFCQSLRIGDANLDHQFE